MAEHIHDDDGTVEGCPGCFSDPSPKHYRKRTTDLHPLFGGANITEYNAGKKWRAGIPRAGADD